MTAWYGDQIHQLLKKAQTNATILDIMDISLKQNILTPYTGFLIFRPEENTGYQQEEDDGDGGGDETPTNIEIAKEDSLSEAIELDAYPNPFNETVKLTFVVLATAVPQKITLIIYNYLGQKVEEFLFAGNLIGRQQVIWKAKNGSNSVSSGVYFAVLTGSSWKKTVKLILIR
jgi:hypothetical protein